MAKTIKYKPFRTDFELVTKFIIGKIILHSRFCEVKIAYDYTSKFFEDGIRKEKKEPIRAHYLLRKENMSIVRSITYHPLDEREDKPCGHIVEILYPGGNYWVWATEKEIDLIFKQLKTWLMS